MMHHFLLISLSMALLVLIAGLFLLAYAKKENLGKISKLVAFVAIAFGTIVFIGGLVCLLMCGSCNQGKCHKNESSCQREMSKDCGNRCSSAAMKCHGDMKCEGNMNAACEGKDAAHCASKMENCNGHCDKSKMECTANDKDCCKDKKVIIEKEVKIIK